jgi:hypothetical protein
LVGEVVGTFLERYEGGVAGAAIDITNTGFTNVSANGLFVATAHTGALAGGSDGAYGGTSTPSTNMRFNPVPPEDKGYDVALLGEPCIASGWTYIDYTPPIVSQGLFTVAHTGYLQVGPSAFYYQADLARFWFDNYTKALRLQVANVDYTGFDVDAVAIATVPDGEWLYQQIDFSPSGVSARVTNAAGAVLYTYGPTLPGFRMISNGIWVQTAGRRPAGGPGVLAWDANVYQDETRYVWPDVVVGSGWSVL